MGAENRKSGTENVSSARLSAPPGFGPLSSFFLKKVENCDEILGYIGSNGEPTQEQLKGEAKPYTVDVEKLKKSVKNRPWIIYDKSDQSAKEFQPEQPDKIEALKQATEKQCPADAVRGLEDVPAFHPSEEEFSDILKYIESIRLKAESYGVCRIIPPASWQPPCLVKEKHMWECSKFVTQCQQFNKFSAQSAECKTAEFYGSPSKRSLGISSKKGVSTGCLMNHDEVGCSDMECNVSKPGPEFTLKNFKRYADDFRRQYFSSKHKHESNHINSKQEEPSVERIEREYRHIVENSTQELEVLYGDNLDSLTFGSGFPRASDPSESENYPRYARSSWNLINLPQLPGSLLSFESDKTSVLSVPRLRIGMCFSSLCWKVEENHLYSLCYMHLGSPKIWYCIPGRSSFKFEAVMKKCLPDLLVKEFKLRQGVIRRLSPFMLKAENLPVYRCIQHPREFVLVFPGAYLSAFDCGFNVAEAVNFAPLDWLPHGLNAVALYQAQGQKTSISFDKLLIEAAREAVRAQWELSLIKKKTNDNLRWKAACGKNGIFVKTLKIFLYRYSISELNILVEAVEGTLPAMYRWAKEDLNMTLHKSLPKKNSSTEDKAQKEDMFKDAGTSYDHGWTTASSIKAEMKARLQQRSQYQNAPKSEEKTISVPAIPSLTQDDTSSLLREMMPEASSSSTSLSSSSESEEFADICLNGGKGDISSTSTSRPSPRHARKEVILSELLKKFPRERGKTKHSRSKSKELPMNHPASKKRKKK
ncbi:hypothetical protein CCACVL1_02583 [Corchorus capsularis]|uniref:JmjC domain-containing protein n=1 Tax=Corchorus capsularis TaxID=210143 RepID=A0A1R3K7N2_COCAP|nr:hypothetical protein CCACVL1_02583 [Corchorus capsularis]